METLLLENLAGQKGARFARITYTNKNKEHFTETLILGADYGRMVKENAGLLMGMLVPLAGQNSLEVFDNVTLEEQAILELYNSTLDSLTGDNPLNTNVDTFEPYMVDDTAVKGVKQHKVTKEYYVDGLSVKGSRIVHRAGTYKEVKSKPLTIAKDAIRNTLATARYRRYKFSTLARIAANGEVLEVSEPDAN